MSETPARYCGNCGNELDPEDRFCQNCGRPVIRRRRFLPLRQMYLYLRHRSKKQGSSPLSS